MLAITEDLGCLFGIGMQRSPRIFFESIEFIDFVGNDALYVEIPELSTTWQACSSKETQKGGGVFEVERITSIEDMFCFQIDLPASLQYCKYGESWFSGACNITCSTGVFSLRNGYGARSV